MQFEVMEKILAEARLRRDLASKKPNGEPKLKGVDSSAGQPCATLQAYGPSDLDSYLSSESTLS
jgi:hypothetical protein